MGAKVREVAHRYPYTASRLSLPPQLGVLLTELTEIPDMDSALRKVLSEYLALKLESLEGKIAGFEAKWDMSFEAFSEKCAEGTLERDAYAYEVEKDFWDWEQAVTLKQHYEAIKTPW